MIRALAVVKMLCKSAKPLYIEAFDKGDADLETYEVNTPLRLAHFLAQMMHETDGFTITVENLNYSAARMTQVWPRRFPTIASAKPYEHNPKKLAEKSYGGRMGNGPEGSGDGWKYIGRGPNQLTGKESYAYVSRKLGADFVSNPELVLDPKYVLKIALAEWQQKGCNAMADRNAIKEITLAINGGLIGYQSRVAWFNKVWPVVQTMHGADPQPSWQAANIDHDVEWLQQALCAAGFEVEVDGRKGPETEKAIKAFQKANGLFVDGVAGEKTRAMLRGSMAQEAGKLPKQAPPSDPVDTTAPGVGVAALAEAGQQVLDKTSLLQQFSDIDWVKPLLAIVTTIGIGLVIWGLVGPQIYAAFRKGAPR